MKINSTTLLLIFLGCFVSSCHRYYTSNSFHQKTAHHKVIAILPPQMVLTGKQPNSVSTSEVAQLEEKESLFFQEELYNRILAKANHGKYVMDVQLQPHKNTLATLSKNNVSIRESWELNDKELASLLNVDAVVRTSIYKNRIMSDLASAGIETGKRILDVVLKNQTPVVGVPSKTNDIKATCTLVSNGETLWSDSYTKASDYSTPANQVIENITNNFAKHFPYKRKA